MKALIARFFAGAATVVAFVFAGVAVGSCASDSSTSADSFGSSTGGSMARFTIVGDFLYTVNRTTLSWVSLRDPARPVHAGELPIIWSSSERNNEIETIFELDNYLFIGSQSAMYIYDVSRPEFPERLSATSHLRSCDPVVAEGSFAFVTLNSSLGSRCGQSRDVLQAYDVSDPTNPRLLGEKALSSPRGLGVDLEDGLVFVCDDGLKAYDVSDPSNITGLYTAMSLPEVGRIDSYDCIVLEGNRLIVIGADGFYQLGYDREKFSFISKIDIRKEE